MCGIAGLVGLPLGSDPAELAAALVGHLRHRGPDHSGHHVDPAGPALLVNTRLAIIDLSPRAAQPMCFDGRHYLVFNGEIFNHHQLRADLQQEGIAFQTTSDTEVLLRLLLHRGRAALALLQGMFALALWDARDRTLLLARDPFGIKPLHVGLAGGGIAFASELRTLLAALPVRPRLRPQGLGEYLHWGCHNPGESLIEGVQSLPPGESWLWSGGRIDRRVFNSIPIALQETHATRAHFRSAWFDAVEKHMVSDVPVGIFLSGGIDSAAVLAAASLRGCPPSMALTLQLEDSDSEAGEAASLAARFSIPHTTHSLSTQEIPGLFQQHLDAQDSPSMDGFNIFCVSHAARRQGLKVILTGLGGDELLGGYPSFLRIPRLRRLFQPLPSWLRPLLAPAPLIHALGASRHTRLLEWISGPPSWSHAYACYRGIFPHASITRMIASLGLPVPPPRPLRPIPLDPNGRMAAPKSPASNSPNTSAINCSSTATPAAWPTALNSATPASMRSSGAPPPPFPSTRASNPASASSSKASPNCPPPSLTAPKPASPCLMIPGSKKTSAPSSPTSPPPWPPMPAPGTKKQPSSPSSIGCTARACPFEPAPPQRLSCHPRLHLFRLHL